MELRREEYRGHVIELRAAREATPNASEATPRTGQEGPELLIDGEVVGYDQLPDGSYALHDYAYDWTDDLFELARRFIDYEAGTR